MQVLTLLPMTWQTISVRWPQTTIQKSRTYWTTINIQVLNIFEAMDLCIVISLRCLDGAYICSLILAYC